MSGFDPNILGALEVGSLASTLCHGALTVQTYHYFSNFPNDNRGLKWAVSFFSNVSIVLFDLLALCKLR